jgi:hypothetical protein
MTISSQREAKEVAKKIKLRIIPLKVGQELEGDEFDLIQKLSVAILPSHRHQNP